MIQETKDKVIMPSFNKIKWNNKRVLVTGAGGFIGSHLVEELLGLNANVTAFIRYNSRNSIGSLEFLSKDQLSSLTLKMGDLRDSDSVRNALRDIDIVFHLGAIISIPYSYVSPKETAETNFTGTANVLQSARDSSIEKLIHTSSSEIFGTAQYIPIDGKHPINPQSPYAASKAGADFLALSFHRSFDLPVAILRPFNTYGPRQSARAVIPTIISQALMSNSIRLGSLNTTRDLTFVKDTVKGFIKLAESDIIGQVVNIGSNFEISINDLVKKISQLMSKDLSVIVEQERMRPPESEVERLRVDNSVAKSLIGWEPEYSLEKGLQKTIEWIQEHIEIYRPERYVI